MNANTALKINDAVHQAVTCGESPEDILRLVRVAMEHALETKQANERAAFARMIEMARL